MRLTSIAAISAMLKLQRFERVPIANRVMRTDDTKQVSLHSLFLILTHFVAQVGYIRDKTQSYQDCMVLIIVLNLIHVIVTICLINRDSGNEQILNVAWHSVMLKQKGAGRSVERGRRISRRFVDRKRKGYQRRTDARM